MKQIWMLLALSALFWAELKAQESRLWVEMDRVWYAAGDSVQLAFIRSGPNTLPREAVQARWLDRQGRVGGQMKVALIDGFGEAGIRLPETPGMYLLQVWSRAGESDSVPQAIERWIAAFPLEMTVPDEAAPMPLSSLSFSQETTAAQVSVEIKAPFTGDVRAETRVELRASRAGRGVISVAAPVWLMPPFEAFPDQNGIPLLPDTLVAERLWVRRVGSETPVTGLVAWYLSRSQRSGAARAVRGEVILRIPVAFERDELFVFEASPFGHQRLEVTVSPPVTPPLPSHWPALPAASPEMKNALLQARKRQLISAAFGPPIVMHSGPAKPQIAPDFSYQGQNYVGIARLRDFFEEMTTGVFVKKGPYPGLRLLNLDGANRFQGPPLFIIDGRAEVDEAAVLDMMWSEVERVELFNRIETARAAFGILGANGVVSITSRRPFDPPAVRLGQRGAILSDWRYPLSEGLLPEVSYPAFHPDLRLTEVWTSRVDLRQLSAVISFRRSDSRQPLLMRIDWRGDDGAAQTYWRPLWDKR